MWVKLAMLGAAASLALATRTAGATGLCENVGTLYDPPRWFSETEETFVVPAHHRWCEEQDPVETGDPELRGSFDFFEVRNLKNEIVEVLASARGKTAQRLTELKGKFTSVPAGRLAATLEKRGYRSLAAGATSPAGGCTVRSTWTHQRGGRTGKIFLEVRAGTQELVRKEIGEGATSRRGKAVVRAQLLAKRAAIAAWALVPTCDGPPPGYFGPDDPGECYPNDAPKMIVLDAATTPAILACFAKP
ncbi:MAG: hypothetical protein ACTHU0_10420 [Kofleriaceae bacterium]